jgi:hypothetical protein
MAAIPKPRTISLRRLVAWISLLALSEIADLLTTQAAMARGGIEANRVTAGLIAIGGLGLLWLVKGLLVAAMAGAVWIVGRCWSESHDQRWAVAGSVVWRGLQLCVVVLALTALHNLSVLRQLNS